jgi:hypothetical protein
LDEYQSGEITAMSPIDADAVVANTRAPQEIAVL